MTTDTETLLSSFVRAAASDRGVTFVDRREQAERDTGVESERQRHAEQALHRAPMRQLSQSPPLRDDVCRAAVCIPRRLL